MLEYLGQLNKKPTDSELLLPANLFYRLTDDFFYNAGIRDEFGIGWVNSRTWSAEDGGRWVMDYPEEIRGCLHGIPIPYKFIEKRGDLKDFYIIIDIYHEYKKLNRLVYKGTFGIRVEDVFDWESKMGTHSMHWRGRFVVVPLVLWHKFADGELKDNIEVEITKQPKLL